MADVSSPAQPLLTSSQRALGSGRNGSSCNQRLKKTMLELRGRQRAVLVDKLPDLANVAVGAMSFGQFLSGQPFSFKLALAGIGVWFILTGFAVSLAGKDRS